MFNKRWNLILACLAPLFVGVNFVSGHWFWAAVWVLIGGLEFHVYLEKSQEEGREE